MQLVLDTHGLVVKVRNRRFHVRLRADPKAPAGEKPTQRFISPEQLSSIAVTADCLLSTAAIRLAVEHQIPIFLLGPTGALEGRLWSPHFVGLAALRRAQALWHESASAWAWAEAIVALKLERQQALLADLPPEAERVLPPPPADFGPDDAGLADAEARRARLFQQEAQAARSYWPRLAAALPPDWRFESRSRRPAQDPFNAALNYLYGMLYPVVEGAVFAAGLDPYMGLLHAEEYDRPALAFDLIEPFRPWVDALLLDLCGSQRLDLRHFEARDGGWWAGKPARAVLIPAFNDFLQQRRPADGEDRTVKNHIHDFAARLAADIRQWYEQRSPASGA